MVGLNYVLTGSVCVWCSSGASNQIVYHKNHRKRGQQLVMVSPKVTKSIWVVIHVEFSTSISRNSALLKRQTPWLQAFFSISYTLYLPLSSSCTLSFSRPADAAIVILLSSEHLFPIRACARDVLLPIEGDFINLPPTLPRKSNFLQLSKGYSWNIYRVGIKLESWNLNNVWIFCLFFSSGIQNTYSFTAAHIHYIYTLYEHMHKDAHIFLAIFTFTWLCID